MTAFERYRPAIGVYNLAIAVMAAIFGGVVLQGGTPVKPEYYGPVVYAIPALVWTALQFGMAFLGAVGAAFRFPISAAIGNFGLFALFNFFAFAAAIAGASGTLLVAMAVPSAAMCALCGAVCWRGRNE